MAARLRAAGNPVLGCRPPGRPGYLDPATSGLRRRDAGGARTRKPRPGACRYAMRWIRRVDRLVRTRRRPRMRGRRPVGACGRSGPRSAKVESRPPRLCRSGSSHEPGETRRLWQSRRCIRIRMEILGLDMIDRNAAREGRKVQVVVPGPQANVPDLRDELGTLAMLLHSSRRTCMKSSFISRLPGIADGDRRRGSPVIAPR